MTPVFNFFVETVLPLLTAACLGGIVGWEREIGDKPVGLRTHMMVSLGAAVFTLASLQAITEYDTGSGDPSRIVMGVATGIGFLGAGSIIRLRGDVRGVTTAAGIWVVGAIGVCCGASYYAIAIVAVALAMVILSVLHRVERRIQKNKSI